MDGVDDYLVLPSMTFTDIYIDCKPDFKVNALLQYVFDCRETGTGYLYSQSGLETFGSAITMYKNGVLVKSGTDFLPTASERVMLRSVTSAQTSKIYFASRFTLAEYLKMDMYTVKVYNGATLLASYDFTQGNVLDISGNGRHGTLIGGTFIQDDVAPVNHTKTVNDIITISDTVKHSTMKHIGIVETISISDSVSRTTQLSVNLSDNIVLNDNMSKSLSRLLTETLTLTDSVDRLLNKSIIISDNLSLVDAIHKAIDKVTYDTVTLTDTATGTKQLYMAIADSINLKDMLTGESDAVTSRVHLIGRVEQTIRLVGDVETKVYLVGERVIELFLRGEIDDG